MSLLYLHFERMLALNPAMGLTLQRWPPRLKPPLLKMMGMLHLQGTRERPVQEDVQAGLDSGAAGDWVHPASRDRHRGYPQGPTIEKQRP